SLKTCTFEEISLIPFIYLIPNIVVCFVALDNETAISCCDTFGIRTGYLLFSSYLEAEVYPF
uniref:NADH dehydrogenase subunit 1 n=1 Tax=Parascaris univalens TaxID=6257 RepID=A0A915BBX1_PARUN